MDVLDASSWFPSDPTEDGPRTGRAIYTRNLEGWIFGFCATNSDHCPPQARFHPCGRKSGDGPVGKVCPREHCLRDGTWGSLYYLGDAQKCIKSSVYGHLGSSFAHS